MLSSASPGTTVKQKAHTKWETNFKIVINALFTFFALLLELSKNSKQINQSSIKSSQVHKTNATDEIFIMWKD